MNDFEKLKDVLEKAYLKGIEVTFYGNENIRASFCNIVEAEWSNYDEKVCINAGKYHGLMEHELLNNILDILKEVVKIMNNEED